MVKWVGDECGVEWLVGGKVFNEVGESDDVVWDGEEVGMGEMDLVVGR